MTDIRFEPGVVDRALTTERWTLLTRAGLDLESIGTWDPVLARRSRILVPIDVQAFVVPDTGGEPTVALTGDSRDPEPFAASTLRPAGVHLHWAMPDSLLNGRDGDAGDVVFPMLPDRWTVVRVLFPNGQRQAVVSGWVIDAPTGRTATYASFSGTFTGVGADLFEPLDAARGGSLTWTASYEASAGRFAFHDPLDDLDALRENAPQGFHNEHAVYVVAGWYTDLAGDPLAAALGPTALESTLASLGWTLSSDAAAVGEQPVDADRARAAKVLSDLPMVETSVVLAAGERQSVSAVTGAAYLPVRDASVVVFGQDQPTYASLLHGAVLGVPIDGSIDADGRPATADCTLAVGVDTDDVVAAFAAPSLGITGASRVGLEQLAAAFSSNMLDRFRTPDGLDELAEQEHRDGFWSFAGAPLPLARADRLRADDSVALGPTAVGRKGRSMRAASLATAFEWHSTLGLTAGKRTAKQPRTAEATLPRSATDSRTVTKPAPRLFRPRPPMVAIRGARPDHRHHGDGLFDASGRLRCRVVGECQVDIDGGVSGTAVVPSIGSGAVPDETAVIVREAVVLDPYALDWLAAAGAAGQGPQVFEAYRTRFAGEMMLRFGTTATYDGSSHLPARSVGLQSRRRRPSASAAGPQWGDIGGPAGRFDHELAGVLVDYSLIGGTAPSPVAITTWRQPWVPVWLEWKVSLEGSDRMVGWKLDGLDLEPTDEQAPTITRTIAGRSPIGQGASTALHEGIRAWLDAEVARDDAGRGVLPPTEQTTLESLGNLLGPIDLISASFDGVVEHLLGIPYVGVLARDQLTGLPVAADLPIPLFGGVLRLDALRLIDAFGRVLDIDPQDALTTSTLAVDGAAMQLRPRVQHGARWLFRLVDPTYPTDADPAAAPEAFVDQLAPELAVNPVAGFLLPDHIDEALEVFTVAGEPLGQLGHDPVSGAVTWEPAPGRLVPPDAGPFEGTGPAERIVADLSTGLVAADVHARIEKPTSTGSDIGRETPLTALLRAVDTTLWTVDTYATLGTASVSALTGRPIAVVRATLRLDVPDDTAEVLVTFSGGADARRAAFRAIDEERFPVRLGELHRSDDSLLGFFVDDDYRRFRVVDKVVAHHAVITGRHQGYLGLHGHPDEHATSPILHPYLVDDDLLWLRPGQTLRLTLLMLPAGKVHLTSGLLPRKELALADDWITPGLRKLSPSVRVGPVLVDPTEIRLPLVHTLGDAQTFTRRTGPLTWRDDPIVAASQTAFLPTLPHEAQEGWVRVTPVEPPEMST